MPRKSPAPRQPIPLFIQPSPNVPWLRTPAPRSLFRRCLALMPPPSPTRSPPSRRLWDSLADDFALLRVINRGFGGSGVDECLYAFERLVVPLRPQAVVLYAGDNDLTRGRSPAEVVADTAAIARDLERCCGAVPLICVGIKPSTARWHLRDAVTETNAGLAALCQSHPHPRPKIPRRLPQSP